MRAEYLYEHDEGIFVYNYRGEAFSVWSHVEGKWHAEILAGSYANPWEVPVRDGRGRTTFKTRMSAVHAAERTIDTEIERQVNWERKALGEKEDA